mmetsp:Transcript_37332/g.92794  ORF Transcript_37332/g.92794 Transcript_37332/m.92794 type:complete len:207 (+) Transcript_37332:151-771(+)
MQGVPAALRAHGRRGGEKLGSRRDPVLHSSRQGGGGPTRPRQQLHGGGSRPGNEQGQGGRRTSQGTQFLCGRLLRRRGPRGHHRERPRVFQRLYSGCGDADGKRAGGSAGRHLPRTRRGAGGAALVRPRGHRAAVAGGARGHRGQARGVGLRPAPVAPMAGTVGLCPELRPPLAGRRHLQARTLRGAAAAGSAQLARSRGEWRHRA